MNPTTPIVPPSTQSASTVESATAAFLHAAGDKLESAREMAEEKITAATDATRAAAEAAREKLTAATEATREKLAAASEIAREKMAAAGEATRETFQEARSKVEHAGSDLLDWTRANPLASLGTFFAAGFVLGLALRVPHRSDQ